MTADEFYGGANFHSISAATVELKKNAGRVQTVDATAAPAALQLPDATKLRTGAIVYVFQNLSASAEDLLIKDADGSTIKTILAAEVWEVALLDNTTTAGDWIFF
jgi:hypothetical protein